MDLSTLKSVLGASAREVLAEAAFIFLIPKTQPNTQSVKQDKLYQAKLPFKGQVRGHFLLTAPTSFCQRMAFDMLGTQDYGKNTINSADALGEMLSIIAGVTLDKMLASDSCNTWELGLPTTKQISLKEYEGFTRSEFSVALDTDENESVEIAVFIEGETS